METLNIILTFSVAINFMAIIYICLPKIDMTKNNDILPSNF